jgi:hypothetical protein
MPARAAVSAPLPPPPLPKPSVAPKAAKKGLSFRLKAPAATEGQIQAAILDWLRVEQAQGRVVWFARLNGGGMKDRTGRWLAFYRLYLKGRMERSKGMADVHGMLAGGRYFALEVKRPGEIPTPEQADFLSVVRDGGGIGEVVRDFDEVQRVLRSGE